MNSTIAISGQCAVDGSATIPNFVWNLSRAAGSGEEEVVFQIEESGVYQVYKPNYDARFILTDIDPGSATQFMQISPPAVGQSQTTGWDPITETWNYAAGYVGYTTTDLTFRAYVLTPSGSPIPPIPGE